MPTYTIKDYDAEEIASNITSTLTTAFRYFEPGCHLHLTPKKLDPRYLQLCANKEYDYRFAKISSTGGLMYSHKCEVSFAVVVSVEVLIECHQHEGVTVRCRPSWPSFNGTTIEAIAAANLYLEMAQKCAIAECAMREALRNMKGTTDQDAHAWREGCKTFFTRIHKLTELIQNEWKNIQE